MLLRSGITKGLLVLYKACVGLNLDKIQVLLFYETDFMQFNATLMALTAALAMTLGTAPAEQPGYAGHFIGCSLLLLQNCKLNTSMAAEQVTHKNLVHRQTKYLFQYQK